MPLDSRKMPILNGDAMASDKSENALDYSTALDVLKKEYSERDGLDAKTLLDSRTNGGLTYNDFLILPGYIGIPLVDALVRNPRLAQG